MRGTLGAGALHAGARVVLPPGGDLFEGRQQAVVGPLDMVAHCQCGSLRVAIAEGDKQTLVFVQRLGSDAGVEHQAEDVQVHMLAGQAPAA